MAQRATHTLRTRVPHQLAVEMQSLIEAGWFDSIDDLVLDALRRYLEAHREDLAREFLREDVEWGLRGTD